jgi:hypothetical protein
MAAGTCWVVRGVRVACCACRCCLVLPRGAGSGTALMVVQMMRGLMRLVTLSLDRYADWLLGLISTCRCLQSTGMSLKVAVCGL